MSSTHSIVQNVLGLSPRKVVSINNSNMTRAKVYARMIMTKHGIADDANPRKSDLVAVRRVARMGPAGGTHVARARSRESTMDLTRIMTRVITGVRTVSSAQNLQSTSSAELGK